MSEPTASLVTNVATILFAGAGVYFLQLRSAKRSQQELLSFSDTGAEALALYLKEIQNALDRINATLKAIQSEKG